jgi:hypothetical protein
MSRLPLDYEPSPLKTICCTITSRHINCMNRSIPLSAAHGLSQSSSAVIKFCLFILLQPPAVVCNGLLVVFLLNQRNQRRKLQNHGILALLVVTLVTNVIEIPRILHYLRYEYTKPSNSFSCLSWQWLDYLLYAEANAIMCWTTFERHLIIFHGSLLQMPRHRLLFHYFPLLSIIVYLAIFYTICILFYPCQSRFLYELPLCGSPCYLQESILSIAIFSIGLFIRTVCRRQVLHQQPNHWRRYRRMLFQLLSISSVYLVCLGPYASIQFLDSTFELPTVATHIKDKYLFYLYWFLTLLLPFVCLHCLPGTVKYYRKWLTRCVQRHNLVRPFSLRQ